MTIKTGLIIRGNDKDNKLIAHAEDRDDGTYAVYNVIYAAGGDDILKAQFLPDDKFRVRFFGEDGNDILSDTEWKDTLNGGDGDDQIFYTTGRDRIDGGSGFDTLVAEDKVTAIAVTGVERLAIDGILTIETSLVGNFTRIGVLESGKIGHINFLGGAVALDGSVFDKAETFNLEGTKLDDVFNLRGNTSSFVVFGENGDDTVVAGTQGIKVDGGAGNDRITGSALADRLWGRNGNDTIRAGGGDDRIESGSGSDTVFGGDGDDFILISHMSDTDVQAFHGGDGDDTFEIRNTKDANGQIISGGDGNDELIVTGDLRLLEIRGIEMLDVAWKVIADADFLNGFDTITSRRNYGAEITFSSGGTFVLKDADARMSGEIIGSQEADNIDLSAATRGDWSVKAGKGDDRIIGNGGGDVYAAGGDGDDFLLATGKSCMLDGGEGNDILQGNPDNIRDNNRDHLQGGLGSDTFVFAAGSGLDIVMDFRTRQGDRMDLTAVKEITSFQDLVENHSRDHIFGTLITLRTGSTIRLEDVKTLQEDMFIL